MSAAEKLKVLKKRWNADAYVMDALPQIVAIVEAAETVLLVVGCFNAEVGWGHCEGITDRNEWERVACSRCRAVDALTALSEQLGDVT